MITFPEEDTHPLSAPSLVATHFGIDEAAGKDWSAYHCPECNTPIAVPEDIEGHFCNKEVSNDERE